MHLIPNLTEATSSMDSPMNPKAPFILNVNLSSLSLVKRYAICNMQQFTFSLDRQYNSP